MYVCLFVRAWSIDDSSSWPSTASFVHTVRPNTATGPTTSSSEIVGLSSRSAPVKSTRSRTTGRTCSSTAFRSDSTRRAPADRRTRPPTSDPSARRPSSHDRRHSSTVAAPDRVARPVYVSRADGLDNYYSERPVDVRVPRSVAVYRRRTDPNPPSSPTNGVLRSNNCCETFVRI